MRCPAGNLPHQDLTHPTGHQARGRESSGGWETRMGKAAVFAATWNPDVDGNFSARQNMST